MMEYLILGCSCSAGGFASGALLAFIYSAAAMSRSQERMQRKLREARDEAWQGREGREASHGAPRGPRNHRETW